MGPNDGGIKRGDREDTGDLEARETDTVDQGASGSQSGATNPTKLDSSAGSTLAPDMIDNVANSLEEDPDMGQLHVEGKLSDRRTSVDDWTPSDED